MQLIPMGDHTVRIDGSKGDYVRITVTSAPETDENGYTRIYPQVVSMWVPKASLLLLENSIKEILYANA